MSVDPVSLAISVASLTVSATVAWLTLLRRGTVRMVRPLLIAFLDAHGSDGPKIYFRCLLYSTSRRGRVVENLYVRLRRGETRQNFSFWVCGERDKLAAGCGLHVGVDGVALNHHFVLPKDGGRYEFLAGDYVLEVFASVVDSAAPLLLASIPLQLTDEHAKALKNAEESVYFDWWPESARYNAHVVRRAEERLLPAAVRELLGG